MINREATVTRATVTVAAITDRAALRLTVGHLRAFLEQADLAGISDDREVTVLDQAQVDSRWHTVSVRATVKDENTSDIAAVHEKPRD